MGTFYDITGWKFGKLTVIKRVPSLPKSPTTTRWLCQCDCGNRREVNKNNLVNSHTQSCGCYARELSRGNKTGETHGQSRTRLYYTWQSMKQRCYDINARGYQHYGARGISVCEEWLTFENFYAWAQTSGYKETLTIERKDVNGNYEPENCTWVTVAEQNSNKTTSNILELNGMRRNLTEWSRLLKIPTSTIVNRLNRGCSPKEALNADYRRTMSDAEIQRLKESWGEIK